MTRIELLLELENLQHRLDDAMDPLWLGEVDGCPNSICDKCYGALLGAKLAVDWVTEVLSVERDTV